MPTYTATVPAALRSPQNLRWDKRPGDLEASSTDFDEDARRRVQLLHGWLERLNRVIADVRTWAEELDWSPKEIDKPMDDSEIGKHRLPALLMQKDTTKILLEPVARTAAGAEGVIDLYLMPGYDDIASLYYYNGRWNLHYGAAGHPVVATIREAPAKPLSKSSLRRVIEEMKQHAQ